MRFMARHCGPLILEYKDTVYTAQDVVQDVQDNQNINGSHDISSDAGLDVAGSFGQQNSHQTNAEVATAIVHTHPPDVSVDADVTVDGIFELQNQEHDDQSDDLNGDFAVRRSKRKTTQVKMYNVAELKCSVCHKNYRENIPLGTYDGSIICSIECFKNTFSQAFSHQ